MLDILVVFGYLVFIVVVGSWVGKFSNSTQDFFFGGRRFHWWLVGMSCVATLVGSYSFIQYSQVGYEYGMPSLGPYTNEWFVMPLFLIVWLPIFYYNRLESVPEYFEKRFDVRTRRLVIVFLIVYLTGYVGINLLTIGVALKGIMKADPALASTLHFTDLASWWDMNGFLDWQLIIPAVIVAVLSAIYLHSGGQTSVVVTDLLQGFLLLFVGLGVVLGGILSVGGFSEFWHSLPYAHRFPFAHFNYPPTYHFVGDFWNDAAVGTFAFYMINQGILMRFLSARSVDEGRKSMIFVVICLMPLAAIAVGGAGWVGKVLVAQGILPQESSRDIFIAVSRYLAAPGVYGFVIAAVIAALMSTLDTLITAVSAVVVNDIIRPFKPGQDDKYYLEAAKHVALVVTVIGVVLIPVFNTFNSIYQALSYFTSVVMPPLVVVVIFALFSRRFNGKAAYWTLIGGAVFTSLSIKYKFLITPIAHGVDPSGGYGYMRALFGLLVTTVIAVITIGVWGEPPSEAQLKGYSAFDLLSALRRFKGGEPDFRRGELRRMICVPRVQEESQDDAVLLPSDMMQKLALHDGDLVYVCDVRWWLGGLRSTHGKARSHDGEHVVISAKLFEQGNFLPQRKVYIEKVF